MILKIALILFFYYSLMLAQIDPLTGGLIFVPENQTKP